MLPEWEEKLHQEIAKVQEGHHPGLIQSLQGFPERYQTSQAGPF